MLGKHVFTNEGIGIVRFIGLKHGSKSDSLIGVELIGPVRAGEKEKMITFEKRFKERKVRETDPYHRGTVVGAADNEEYVYFNLPPKDEQPYPRGILLHPDDVKLYTKKMVEDSI